jgi:hypothetical protein
MTLGVFFNQTGTEMAEATACCWPERENQRCNLGNGNSISGWRLGEMKPRFVDGNVRANCPDCGGAVTSYEFVSQTTGEFGSVVRPAVRQNQQGRPVSLVYHLHRCASCGRGGLAKVAVTQGVNYPQGELEEFFPRTIDTLTIPENVPAGVRSEFGEAELCASAGAWRAASALLRSTLEKTLRANGYDKGSLADRIDQAAADGTITAARSKRAHEDIRVLGNDVLHDEWRKVTEDEFDVTHHYAQRILEDFYDDRPTVEALLAEKGRMQPPIPSGS